MVPVTGVATESAAPPGARVGTIAAGAGAGVAAPGAGANSAKSPRGFHSDAPSRPALGCRLARPPLIHSWILAVATGPYSFPSAPRMVNIVATVWSGAGQGQRRYPHAFGRGVPCLGRASRPDEPAAHPACPP